MAKQGVRAEGDLPRVTIDLVGQDGNGAAIIGRFRRAASRAGWTSEEVEWFTDEATSGSYDHLLALAQRFEGGDQ